jgi:hypothetical protein
MSPRRARDFTGFAGVERPEEMRRVTRAHRNRLARKTSSAGVWPHRR